MRRGVFVVVAAVVQLAVQLVLLRDMWDTPTGRLVPWLVLEAALAVLIGIAAEDRFQTRAAVLGGWLLQLTWFVVVTPKDENHDLWGIGVVVLAFFGLVALALAVLTHRIRRRTSR